MSDLPPVARLAVWGGAALRGAVSVDDAAEAVVAADPPHRVVGLDGGDVELGVSAALAHLRSRRVSTLRLVLPASGDAGGLPGPSGFNERAIESRGAVLAVGSAPLGLVFVPRRSWQAYVVEPPPVTVLSVAEAEALLRQELRNATEELMRLDVARWRPEAARLLAHGDTRSDIVLPPGHPPRAVRLLVMAWRVGEMADLGLQSEGAAVSASESALRAGVLAQLAKAARRAVEAACNTG